MGSGAQASPYQTGDAAAGAKLRLEQTPANLMTTTFTPATDLHGSPSISGQTPPRMPDSFGSGDSVADELEGFFRLNFPDEESGLERSAFQKAAAAFKRGSSLSPSPSGSHSWNTRPSFVAPASPVTNHDALFSVIMQELVEMLAVKFGKLGCHHLNKMGPTFYIQSLTEDTTKGPFEPFPPSEDPVHDMDDHQVLQMIDVWFSVHPLATIMSKTLFLREYRSNTHDRLLLAVVLADACYAQEGPNANTRAEALFQYASSGLHSRPKQNCTLSTAQTLTLIGWHELCFTRVRRATCFIGCAGRIMSMLKTSVDHTPATGVSQINGLDVGDVEAELINNAYWVTFAITLWAFLQADRPFSEFLPSTVPTVFPPVDERSSAVAKLDVISHNVSTLQVGARRIGELWQLSHVASTAGHIYALLPRSKRVHDARALLSWQARSLQQLRLLSSRQPDMSVLCVQIRRILADAVEHLIRTETVSPSQSYVLTAYQTVMIHLLFPRSDMETDDVVMTATLLDSFCTSVKSLLDVFARLHGDGRSTFLPEPSCCNTANIFTLEIDACARALDYIYTRLVQSIGIERQILYSRRHELFHLAATLHAASKSEKLSSASRLRVVKKQLKKVRMQFEQLSAADAPSEESQQTTNPSTPGLGTPAFGTPTLGASTMGTPVFTEPNYLTDLSGSSLSNFDHLTNFGSAPPPQSQNQTISAAFRPQNALYEPNTVLNSIEGNPFLLENISFPSNNAPPQGLGVAGAEFDELEPLDFSFVKDWAQF